MRTHTVDEARAAKNKAKEVFSELAPVLGVGITKIDSSYGVKVNLRKKPRGVVFPETIDGVPVRITVVGKIRKH